jgi:O-antigen ligase
MALAVFFFCLLIWRFPRSGRKRLLTSSIPLVGILLLAAFSLRWSWDNLVTYKALWFLLAMTSSVVYLGLNYEMDDVLRLFTAVSAILIVVTLITVLVFPERAIMVGKHAGAWRGLFLHKNGLGQTAALMNLVFLVNVGGFRIQSWGRRLYHGLFLVLTMVLVFKSDSATAVILLAVNLGVFLVCLVLIRWGDRLRPVHWLGGSVIALAGLVVAWQARHFIVEGLLGRKPTLTGRIPLWLHLVPFVERRLLLGYGFGLAFWSHPDNTRRIYALTGWRPHHAHNGFLDVALSLGILGLLVFILFFFQTLVLSLKLILSSRTVISTLPLLLLAFAFAANVTESSLVMGDRLPWLAWVAAWAISVRALIVVPQQRSARAESQTDLAVDPSAARETG